MFRAGATAPAAFFRRHTMDTSNPSELEQLERTAEMFEMILQATPGAVENYDNLKDIYRRLEQPDKVKDAAFRLAAYYMQCGDSHSAMTELEKASKEFPNDPSINAKLVELGLADPTRDFAQCMSEYERACIHCEDLRMGLRLAVNETDNARRQARKIKEETHFGPGTVKKIATETAERKIELLKTAYARRTIRRSAVIFSELKAAFEEDMLQAVRDNPDNLPRGFKTAEKLLVKLDSEHAKKLSETVFDFNEPAEQDFQRIRREETQRAENALAAPDTAHGPAKQTLHDNEELCRGLAEELLKAEKKMTDLESHLRESIPTLPEEKRAKAEAELAALSGGIEVVPIESQILRMELENVHDSAPNIDEIGRRLEEKTARTEESDSSPTRDEARPQPAPDSPLARSGEAHETLSASRKPAAELSQPGMDELALQKSRKLGQLLIAKGIITEKNLEEALKIQRETGKKLGMILIGLGYSTDAEILDCLAVQTGMPYLPLGSYEINPRAAAVLPAEIATRHGVVPVDIISNTLLLAMAAPLEQSTKQELKACVGQMKISYYISSPTEVDEKLNELYPS